jgi:exosome complex component RRP46
MMLQNLPVIPALLHAAILGLLSAAVPLKATATATTLAVVVSDADRSNKVIISPSPLEIDKAASIHVFGFTSQDNLLFVESEGPFQLEEWNEAEMLARKACCQQRQDSGLDAIMSSGNQDFADMRHFIRSTMEEKVASDLQWKTAV